MIVCTLLLLQLFPSALFAMTVPSLRVNSVQWSSTRTAISVLLVVDIVIVIQIERIMFWIRILVV
jgi:hypothetical protein